MVSYPGQCIEEWLWTKVLVTLKARGPDSKSASAALVRAMQLNKRVYSLLVGDEILERTEVDEARARGKQYVKMMILFDEPIVYFGYCFVYDNVLLMRFILILFLFYSIVVLVL